MQNNQKPTNEKIFRMSDFKSPIEDGQNNFLILDAKNDTISTVNGDSQIIVLKVEISNPTDPARKLLIRQYNLFIDLAPNSDFHKFATSVVEVLTGDTFVPSNLLGLKGTVELSSKTPKDNGVSYKDLKEWVFKASPDRMKHELIEHYGSESFEITDEDINF